MRLLEYIRDSEYCLTKDFGDDVPRYAILSHTWGADSEEVTFRDLADGTGKDKKGYDKIRFCGEQAKRDGFEYFWIDTCCIDKSNNTELSEAINSMFRWYRNAAICYVYLSDVSRSASEGDKSTEQSWESSFRRSRWFTRGWTLQELIAPESVEFFSKDGENLGNKVTLERYIHEIARIPVKALRGSPLSDFSVNERILWIDKRETTRKEDKAYSLLGIFNVYMPLLYGEGREKAFNRLREEIDKTSKGTPLSRKKVVIKITDASEPLLTGIGIKHKDFSVSFSLSGVPGIELFVAREEELAEMHKNLSSDGSHAMIILHGLGGIGKTQLSIAYAKRYKDSYSAIFWLNVKDKDSLKQSFARIARQILKEHPSASRLSSIDTKENFDEVIDAVKAWLSLRNNTQWLLIYDNYDNPKVVNNTDPAAIDICEYLPESYQGSVIITTRLSQVKIGHRIPITKLQSIQDSLEILSNTSSREGLINDPDAVRLAEELDGFPLALATAGAYLDQTAVSFSEYLQLYKQSWSKLQKTSPKLGSYEDRTLYSTWQVSYDHVEEQNRLSANLLRLWAYFDNQDLWFELLRHGTSADPDWILELTEDELSFHSAMRVLCDHGLVNVDRNSLESIESRGYSIHGCVHSWIIHSLNHEWDYDLARVAVEFVASHIPDDSAAQSWMTQQRLLQHVAKCSYTVSNILVKQDSIAWACNRLGQLYTGQGKLAEAHQMFQRALQDMEKTLGAEHISTLRTFNNLGILYRNQGKLDEADQMYQRALQGTEKALGAEHISTLDTVYNLGTLYMDQGKLAEAEQMYQRALQGYEKALGAEHISTLDTVHNLGILYKDQSKLAEAEKMFQRALQGYEKALGAENIDTYIPALNTIWGLGNIFSHRGDFAKAKIMYSKALMGYERVVGADHPESRRLREILRDLGTREREQSSKEGERASGQVSERTAVYTAGEARTLPTSKRFRLLKKLGLR